MIRILDKLFNLANVVFASMTIVALVQGEPFRKWYVVSVLAVWVVDQFIALIKPSEV